jgi:hypothetical protein
VIRNDEGATINAGTPIYSKGEIGGSDRIRVGIADASDPARMPAIGIAETTLNTTDAKDGHGIITGVLAGCHKPSRRAHTLFKTLVSS